jgi:hypothetical protein
VSALRNGSPGSIPGRVAILFSVVSSPAYNSSTSHTQAEGRVAMVLPRNSSSPGCCFKMQVRGEDRWRAHCYELGRVHRKFFRAGLTLLLLPPRFAMKPLVKAAQPVKKKFRMNAAAKAKISAAAKAKRAKIKAEKK